jgi:hypothetical protein
MHSLGCWSPTTNSSSTRSSTLGLDKMVVRILPRLPVSRVISVRISPSGLSVTPTSDGRRTGCPSMSLPTARHQADYVISGRAAGTMMGFRNGNGLPCLPFEPPADLAAVAERAPAQRQAVRQGPFVSTPSKAGRMAALMQFRQLHASGKARICCVDSQMHQLLVIIISVRAYDDLIDYIGEHPVQINVLR